MYNNATFVDKEQLKNLEKMDKFVKDNMGRFEGIGEEIREVIQKIIEKGYYFTGPESTITTSYLYVLVLLHLAHLTAGITIVLNVFFKTLKGAYEQGNTLGFELAVTFWHFLDILWVYLFLFGSFYG